MKKNNKQHFVDLGSKQKELSRNDKARVTQWGDKSKAQEHIAHNQALEDWDYLKLHHRDHTSLAHSGKKGPNRPL
jgi:hypothetical protein